MIGKASIDRPWIKYYPKGTDKIPLPQMTVYQYLYEQNKNSMNGIALEYCGIKISYVNFFDAIESVSRAFVTLKVKHNDIVTICMPNTPEAVYAFYSLNQLGACANMISPMFTAEHIEKSIDLTNSKIVVILDAFFTHLAPVIAHTKVEKIIVVSGMEALGKCTNVSEQSNIISWRSFIKCGKNAEIKAETTYIPQIPAAIVYSSGSTGAVKGIVLTNDSFNSLAAIHTVDNIKLHRGESCLSIIPCFFSTGINVSLNMPLCKGITAILEPKFSKESFMNTMLNSKPNHIIAPTSLWEAVLDDCEVQKADLSFLMLIIAGGEALPETLRQSINVFLEQHNATARIERGWGMCEFGSAVTIGTSAINGVKAKYCGVGIPLPQVIVSVFDPDSDEELNYNERGEIRVVTPCHMLGYYKNPEATETFFRKGKDGQAWGCSGDVGYVDKEGNVFIEGRTTDYIYGKNGNKVWLFDIENVLLSDEAVQLCEVVGIALGGTQIPVAHLVLKQRYANDLENIIRRVNKNCVELLAPDAVPHGYKIRDSFDVLPSGKRNTLSLMNERDDFVAIENQKLCTICFNKAYNS